ncbi:MAG: hypothetical protein R3F41_08020 [Gammaproteobacteria bacterium]|nr:hypothetical protein [Pseudomonadales bacterium]
MTSIPRVFRRDCLPDAAPIPVSLVDIDKFAELLVDYYETFDIEGKALIPLARTYWPADN